MRVWSSLIVVIAIVFAVGCGKGASQVTAPEDVASDPAFAAAVEEAKASFSSEFVPAWRTKKNSNTFQVLVGYPSDVGGTVYVWIEVTDLAGGKVIGELAQHPEFTIGKEIGDKVSVSPDEVVDWMYYDIDGNVTGDYTTDAYTEYLIRKRG